MSDCVVNAWPFLLMYLAIMSVQRRVTGSAGLCRAAGYTPLLSIEYMLNALPISLSDARHLTLLAERRADWSVGSRIEISSAMMPMTTSSSTRVNARRPERDRRVETRAPL